MKDGPATSTGSHWRAALVLLGATLVCLAPSRAAYADAAAEARFHDELARRHYAARRYEEAAREFMIEQRLAPNSNIVFNIALCFQLLNRQPEAYMYFAEYLASENTDRPRREQSEQALETLRPGVALVNVRSEPPGAAIWVDRRELGQYGVTPRVLALSAGEHRIWAELDGHRDAEETITLEVGALAEVLFALPPILGRLLVDAGTAAHVRVLDPEESVVFEGETPVDTLLPPGSYEVEATSGVEHWSDSVIVRGERVTRAVAALRGPTGEVTVTANVAGALVSMDGRERGFTPQVISDVPVGEHELRVRAEGMRSYRSAVEVEEEGHLWFSVELNPESSVAVSPFTWALGAVAALMAIGAGVATGLAFDAQARFDEARGELRPAGDIGNDGFAFSVVADVLWLGAGVVAAATVILTLFTFDDEGEPSRASITRSAQ